MKYPIRTLPINLRKNGFDYTQVSRGERSFVYAQHGTPSVTYYEVFLLKISREKCINGKIIEARERFPSNEDFGYSAWTYRSLVRAREKFEVLEGGGDGE